MEYKAIFAKSFSRDERRKLGYGAFIGCLILVFSFFTVFRPSLEQLLPISGHYCLEGDRVLNSSVNLQFRQFIKFGALSASIQP
ncbi:hypothetical protein Scep_002172 [Stephania cephalantha]|uniref:Uncharacterized protein n=1 Tax=Stephania cephalantha TaxID=152367 RepID=A0AAP0L9S7_9MAGN